MPQCPEFALTLYNGTVVTTLNSTIAGVFQNSSFDASVALTYCAGSRDGPCLGICPNPDLSGPGVRYAFYVQSFTNTLLIVLSHSESAQGAWTATILTAAIIIPAMIQKVEVLLSLHHATLVLNFATFSTIASLASAPLCWVWNTDAIAELTVKRNINRTAEDLYYARQAKKKAREIGQKARIVLSVALIIQIALQWSWAIMLFTRPVYDQTSCSGQTTVYLFGQPFQADDVNNRIYIWAGWIFFCTFITFFWGVLLVFHSSKSALNDTPSRWVSWSSRGGASIICLIFLVSSELQVGSNCILGNESEWGFGQMTAMLLAATPIWGIVVAGHEKFNRWWEKRTIGHRNAIGHLAAHATTTAAPQFHVPLLTGSPRGSDYSLYLASYMDSPPVSRHRSSPSADPLLSPGHLVETGLVSANRLRQLTSQDYQRASGSGTQGRAPEITVEAASDDTHQHHHSDSWSTSNSMTGNMPDAALYQPLQPTSPDAHKTLTPGFPQEHGGHHSRNETGSLSSVATLVGQSLSRSSSGNGKGKEKEVDETPGRHSPSPSSDRRRPIFPFMNSPPSTSRPQDVSLPLLPPVPLSPPITLPHLPLGSRRESQVDLLFGYNPLSFDWTRSDLGGPMPITPPPKKRQP